MVCLPTIQLFSSPTGDFVIYTFNIFLKKCQVTLFSSPTGDFVIYTKIVIAIIAITTFSSPTGDFVIYTHTQFFIVVLRRGFSSPTGDFVIYTGNNNAYDIVIRVFVPYRGFCYLYNCYPYLSG